MSKGEVYILSDFQLEFSNFNDAYTKLARVLAPLHSASDENSLGTIDYSGTCLDLDQEKERT